MASPCEGSQDGSELPFSVDNYFKIGNIGGPSGWFSNLSDKISTRMGSKCTMWPVAFGGLAFESLCLGNSNTDNCA